MPPRTRAIRSLILSLVYPHQASYYDDWRDAFVESHDYDCVLFNILSASPRTLALKLDDCDVAIMLHSCNADTLDYFSRIASVLAARKRTKLVSFVGNEYNSPYVSMVERIRLLRQARCDLIATQLPHEAGIFLYASTGARVIAMPHALNPRVFTPGPAQAKRPIDIGVKGYRYPPYLGDDDRNRMLRHFAEKAERYGLRVEIGEDRRSSREDWARFLQSCRGTVSTEAGSWYLEPDDRLIREVYEYLCSKRSGLVIKNDSVLRRTARILPMPVKSLLWRILRHGPVKFEMLDDFKTSFLELNDRFFRCAPRAPVYSKAISSRHFDAIGTKTCQLMLRGRYNDILTADEHYLAIEPDFSNADKVVHRFKDAAERQRIVDAAYEHALSAHTYAHRAAALRRHLDEL